MTKENKKEKEKELFAKFLNENGWGVYNDSFSGKYLTIRKPKASEKKHDYYYEEALNSDLEHLTPNDATSKFFDWLLNKGEHDFLAKQAIKKTPRKNSYEYDSSVTKIIDSISKNKKILFEYVARPSFLDSSWSNLEKNGVFNIIGDQEYRIAIFEAMVNTKTFKSLDTQKSVYNLIQKHLKQPEKFEKYFNRIEKVKEDDDAIDFIQSPAILVIGLTKEKLIGANLNTSISSDTLINSISSFSKKLKDLFPEDLKINNTFMDYQEDKKQHLLNILCDQSTAEFNKFFFSKFINTFCRLSTWNEMTTFMEDVNINLFLKETKSEFLHKNLQQDLTETKINKKSFKV